MWWRWSRDAIATSPVDTLGRDTTTGWIMQSGTRATRILTNGQFRYRFLRWNATAHDFARTSHDCCNHGNPVAFGDCHSAFHQSPMPSESEPVCVWSQHGKRSSTLSRYGFARERLRGSRVILQPGVFTAHSKSTT